MADDFDLTALAKSWQQQTLVQESAPDSADLAKASQRQRGQKWLMYAEWLGALIMLFTAGVLLLNLPDWLGYSSAAFLLLGAVSTVYVSWCIHRPILAYDNWSSAGLLQFRQQACRLSLRYYRFSQFSCAALLLFTAVLWGLYRWQLAEVTAILLQFYSFIVCPLCLWAIYQLQRKVRQKATELQHLSQLANEFNL